METMTPKERIDAVIKHQAVDRTPFTVVDTTKSIRAG